MLTCNQAVDQFVSEIAANERDREKSDKLEALQLSADEWTRIDLFLNVLQVRPSHSSLCKDTEPVHRALRMHSTSSHPIYGPHFTSLSQHSKSSMLNGLPKVPKRRTCHSIKQLKQHCRKSTSTTRRPVTLPPMYLQWVSKFAT